METVLGFVEDLVGVAGQQAQAGSVFPVDHGEVDVMLPLKLGKAAIQKIKTGLGDHIPHGEYVQFQGSFLRLHRLNYSILEFT